MTRFVRAALLSCLLLPGFNAAADTSPGNLAQVKALHVDRNLSEEGKACISCHRDVTPGQVADWKQSRHATQGSPA